MNFNNSLELTQSQKLIITMQLKQSLNILNMSKLELEEEIKREYEENPLLEVEKSSEVDWKNILKILKIHVRVIKMNYIIIMIMI